MTDSEAAPASDPAAAEGSGGNGTTAPDADPTADEGSYGGVLGAFPYAFRRSDSRLFRLYAAVGGLLAALLTVFFGLALVVQIFNTLSGTGGVFTFSRALFVMMGLFVVGPTIAPVLLVARRHRRTGSTARYDRLLGASGVLFLLSLYLAVLASAPPDLRSPASGVLAPVVDLLYAMPAPTAVVFPVAGAVGILAAHHLAG